MSGIASRAWRNLLVRSQPAEPTHKPILLTNDGFTVYWNGGNCTLDTIMRPGYVRVGDHVATPEQLARGWMDLDQPAL